MRTLFNWKILLICMSVFMLAISAYAETRGVSKTEIKIGTHTALSGPVAGWGVDATNAIRLRFDEVNSEGGIHGRKITYIAEDSQYQVPLAVQKANKLINRDGIFIMLAAMGTPHNNAVFQTQLKKQVPSLFPYSFSRPMVEPFHKLKFIMQSTYYDQARAAVKYFVEEKGKKRIGLMYLDNDFGMETVDGVMDQLKAMNMKLTAKTSHKTTETNFVANINKLRKAKCDIVFLGTIIKDTMLPVSTARKMGWDVDFVGTMGACNTIVAEKGGPEMNGLYALTGWPIMYEDRATGRTKAFFENFKNRYGKTPTEVAQGAYVAADLTVMALQKAGENLTLDTFLSGLESIKNYEWIFGGMELNFSDSQHKGSNDSLLLQVQNGRWVSPVKGKKVILSY